jgi:hypothetical protein
MTLKMYKSNVCGIVKMIFFFQQDLHINLAKSYCRIDRQDLALPHAVKVADQQLDNPQLLLFTAHTAAQANEHDVCSKWCTYLLEHFSDESITTPVKF